MNWSWFHEMQYFHSWGCYVCNIFLGIFRHSTQCYWNYQQTGTDHRPGQHATVRSHGRQRRVPHYGERKTLWILVVEKSEVVVDGYADRVAHERARQVHVPMQQMSQQRGDTISVHGVPCKFRWFHSPRFVNFFSCISRDLHYYFVSRRILTSAFLVIKPPVTNTRWTRSALVSTTELWESVLDLAAINRARYPSTLVYDRSSTHVSARTLTATCLLATPWRRYAVRFDPRSTWRFIYEFFSIRSCNTPRTARRNRKALA